MSDVRVPLLVQQRVAQLGPAGAAWLAGLDGLVADLERRWSIRVGAPLSGGSASYVARARTADDRDVVLKLAPPDPDLHTAGQVRTLAAAQGAGYAVLLAHDVERGALLLEALGPPMSRLGLPVERQLPLLAGLLTRAWQVPRADDAPEPDQAQVLAGLVGRLWEELDRPCPERVVAVALRCADRRGAATGPDRRVVVHGDPHPDNALQVLAPRAGAPSGFVLVDPDGFVADPAYDLGVVLRGWCDELLAVDPVAAPVLARGWCRVLAAHTGLPEAAVWEWGLLERVSSGLYLMRLGAQEEGRRHLRSAELLTTSDSP